MTYEQAAYRRHPLDAEAPTVTGQPQTELRDRIRRAVCEAEGFAWDSDMLEPDEYSEVADAVLAVLPPPADRAAVLHEAADDLAEFIALHGPTSRTVAGWRGAVGFLRRLSTEAQQPAAADTGEETEARGGRVVAYRDPNVARVLLCREHGLRYVGMVPVTAEELPDGGICTFGRLSSLECGRDVLIDPKAPQ